MRSSCIWLVALGLYFGFWLLPKLFPGLGGSNLFFLYVLSIPATVLALAGLFVFGAGAAVVSIRRGSVVANRYRVFAIVPVLGAILLVGVLALNRLIPSPLPSGSHLLPFDSDEWKAQGAASYESIGTATTRQMMLGSLVERLEPSMTRSEVEDLLGEPHPRDFPLGIGDSDIHYRTGPQRDAYFGLDSEWLFIWFDDSGHFERYAIYVD